MYFRTVDHERESTRFGVFSQFFVEMDLAGRVSGPRVSTVGSESSLSFSLFFFPLHVRILTLHLVFVLFLIFWPH